MSADASDDTLDSQGADDFVVPPGQVWSITSVFAPGSNGATHAPPFLVPGVNVFIYEDGGDEPGALITSYLGVPPTTAPDDLTVPLSPALTLQPGTYWISVQADVSSLGPGNGWLWAYPPGSNRRRGCLAESGRRVRGRFRGLDPAPRGQRGGLRVRSARDLRERLGRLRPRT